jgi:hypothetical protein
LDPLLPPPATLAAPGGGLLHGRWGGALREDPLLLAPRAGRTRRWCYAAAGDDRVRVGAAVVVLGPLAVAFAWAHVDGRTVSLDRRVPLRRGTWVARTPAGGAGRHTADEVLLLGGDGSIELDLPLDADGGYDGARPAPGDRTAERLRARVEVTADVTPLLLTTETPGGGWNCTVKAAGTTVRGTVAVGDHEWTLSERAGGWRDWTSGRQDRTTVWRWAAAAGHASDGRRVGLNVGTGLNAAGDGEDVCWWDGVPVPLRVNTLRPRSESDAAGAWEVGGPGWHLSFEADGVRAKHERLPLVVSRYVQPIGTFTGTLPDPDGRPREVHLTGVTEDHLAIW